MRITKDRWEEAQKEEYRLSSVDIDPENFEHSYAVIAKLLGVDFDTDFVNKSIVEIGCGPLGASLLVEDFAKATIVEPLIYKWGQQYVDLYLEKNIQMITVPYEDWEITEDADETWFFNVLQHVFDPEEQLLKAMKHSNVIRLFEPIDYPAEIAHPHVLTEQMFKDVLGDDFGTKYIGGSIPSFHTADCYYGTWTK